MFTLKLVSFVDRVQFPPEEFLDYYTQDDSYKLSTIVIEYQPEWGGDMVGFQMVFANGIASPFYRAAYDEDRGEIVNFDIDPNRKIKSVSWRTEDWEAQHYEAIRLWDENDDYILDAVGGDVDGNSDFWPPKQIVSDDQRIIGFRLYESQYHLQNMSFLLGKNGHPGVFSEINFPSLEVYPSFEMFQWKHPESFPAPKFVTLGWNGVTQELSLVKLAFTDGSQTTFESTHFNRNRINQETVEI